MFDNLQAEAHELWLALRRAAERRPRLVMAAMAVALLAVAALAASAWFLDDLRTGLPDEYAIRHMAEMSDATAVYDDTDRQVFAIFQEQRIEVPLSAVSTNLQHAIVAIEDQRFYDHHGFDVHRMISAGLANLRHGRVAQGGSTITQQLARQSFLTTEKTLRRKLQELILAGRIEQVFSKPQILEMYLNKVYFGDGLYGIEAASRGYLGKHASELTVADAALLAGLVKSPSSYAPTVSAARASARRNVVLQAMLDTRAIDRAAFRQARTSTVTLHDNLRADEPHGQYFKEQVRRELVERFGWQRVYQGGLRVFSTIDMPMQIAADAAVAESLKTIEDRRRASAARRKTSAAGDVPLQAALIALDPHSGHVRAMVGGRDFDKSRFNRAVQAKRQPGSAFKPFVYAAALEAGYTPATIIDHLDDPITDVRGAWSPEDGHAAAPEMSLRTALRTSSNRAAVRLLQAVGIPQTVAYARALGVGDLPGVPSLALGSGEVTLQSLTAAYAAFANQGLVPRPTLVRRVEDRDGRTLYECQDEATRAISETTAFLMTSMMADVINAGTGYRARQLGFTLPAAGKTGTTNDFNDAWFVGFTPKLAAGVWVGFDQPRTILRNGFAADIAVPLWARFMKAATRGDAAGWFSPPPGVTTTSICRLSGKLATQDCTEVYTEYFARGTQPSLYCDAHPHRTILERIAGLIGVVEETPAPLAPAATTFSPVPLPETPSLNPPPEDEAAKKRGFWSRLLGLRKANQDKKEEPPQKKKGGY